MMIVLYFFIIFSAFVLAVFLLPVKVTVYAEGGTDGKLKADIGVMILCGLCGGGLGYSEGRYDFALFLNSLKVLSVNVTPIAEWGIKKAKKRPKKPEKEKVKKTLPEQPLQQRIKNSYKKTKEYSGYIKKGYRYLCEAVRIERFSATVNLGLGDPSLTGRIAGIILLINSMLPALCEIVPSWDFTRTVVGGEISVKITIMSHKVWKRVIPLLPHLISRKRKANPSTVTAITQEV